MKRLGQTLDAAAHDPTDPDPWLALWLDRSLPLDDDAKRALVSGNASYSRSFLLPFLRPWLFLLMVLAHLLRRVFIHWPNFNGGLHRLIHWGLKTFATPDTNLVILRHFHIGTELLGFIKANSGVETIASHPLRPRTLRDLEDNVFLQHDLNVFNFVIELNAGLQAQGRELTPVAAPDFSMITDGPFQFDETFPDRPWNFADVQTAVETYTPLYALMLPRHDFVRAVNSLQLDEVIAIYIARILGSDYHLNFIKNGHPLVPLSTFGAGKRLMLHGLDCEALHGWLRTMKRRQAAGCLWTSGWRRPAIEPARASGCYVGMAELLHVVCPHCDGVNRIAAERLRDDPKCGKCKKTLFVGEPVSLDTRRFNIHRSRSDLPLIVDFWAAWCGPCRAIAPVFAAAAKNLEPRARFVKIDVDANPQLSQQFNIQGIPALFVFKGGAIAERQAGLSDPGLFRRWVDAFGAV